MKDDRLERCLDYLDASKDVVWNPAESRFRERYLMTRERVAVSFPSDHCQVTGMDRSRSFCSSSKEHGLSLLERVSLSPHSLDKATGPHRSLELGGTALREATSAIRSCKGILWCFLERRVS